MIIIVLVIVGLRQEEITSVAVGENAVIVNPESFTGDTVVVLLSSSFNDTKNFTNDSVRLENSCCCCCCCCCCC